MERKNAILSNLKRQVLALKSQLQTIHKSKEHKSKQDSSQHRSISQSERFNSGIYDSTYLDKGVKKYGLRERKFQNIAELIYQKSKLESRPSPSPYRKAEQKRTKENFTIDYTPNKSNCKKVPNPVTGEGYSEKKTGIKMITPIYKSVTQTQRLSSKKHFYYYL